MSEPVTPERWRGVLERLRKSKYFGENKVLPQRLAIPIQIIGELSAAEAKVAELTGLIKLAEPYLRTFVSDEQIDAGLSRQEPK